MMTPDTLNSAPPVLELCKVGKTYGSEPAVHALVDVELILERGEWLSITGPSGAGKSTRTPVDNEGLGCPSSFVWTRRGFPGEGIEGHFSG